VKLGDLPDRAIPSVPWHEADNIPWDEPGFSARMLAEHLSQEHDAASRRAATIDRQVAWIHERVLARRPTTILDLGCGPGLYSTRLARLGHTGIGLDFSPAAIAYARAEAAREGTAWRYRHEDMRMADFGTGFGLAMVLYGELNAFPRPVAVVLLRKAWAALDDGGLLLLEPHTEAAIRAMGERPPTWYTRERGLFGETPYLCLQEGFWHPERNASTTRSYVVDLATAAVMRYAQSMQAYSEADYRALLAECGFGEVACYPALTGDAVPEQPDLCVLVARKG
jgi:SAM-dependent methyltransferase